jgi:hypothetical protein
MSLKVEYSSEFEVIFETALGYEPGDQVCLIPGKPEVENLLRLSI